MMDVIERGGKADGPPRRSSRRRSCGVSTGCRVWGSFPERNGVLRIATGAGRGSPGSHAVHAGVQRIRRVRWSSACRSSTICRPVWCGVRRYPAQGSLLDGRSARERPLFL